MQKHSVYIIHMYTMCVNVHEYVSIYLYMYILTHAHTFL